VFCVSSPGTSRRHLTPSHVLLVLVHLLVSSGLRHTAGSAEELLVPGTHSAPSHLLDLQCIDHDTDICA
jgi:hypothetical protein